MIKIHTMIKQIWSNKYDQTNMVKQLRSIKYGQTSMVKQIWSNKYGQTDMVKIWSNNILKDKKISLKN